MLSQLRKVDLAAMVQFSISPKQGVLGMWYGTMGRPTAGGAMANS